MTGPPYARRPAHTVAQDPYGTADPRHGITTAREERRNTREGPVLGQEAEHGALGAPRTERPDGGWA
ncbi:hypothetical protein [Streptomyces sp. B1I3]|uniref:hypothetical protein n=1 Tax=Streptomyces sp. B1I3 TaxID=3042264 RepID=UPI00277F908F|nr:hypothetical protein [Streptomyces sp. B1I3]MDQ0794841.1 hypothetical protein [Streptomyces sp. B1I3]